MLIWIPPTVHIRWCYNDDSQINFWNNSLIITTTAKTIKYWLYNNGWKLFEKHDFIITYTIIAISQYFCTKFQSFQSKSIRRYMRVYLNLNKNILSCITLWRRGRRHTHMFGAYPLQDILSWFLCFGIKLGSPCIQLVWYLSSAVENLI